MDTAFIQLKNITKTFETDKGVLNGIDLDILQKQFVTLLGPSGCGKTTTLRIIGGFETPTKGKVYMNGKDITNLPPYLRNVNTVFQKYALFPHLNVYENIAFGLKIKGVSKEEIKTRVTGMLDMINLSGREKCSINALSGGQQQRVAIARSLVTRPEVLLLDEPLGALDLKLRKGMQLELKNIQKKLGITFVYVTHDQEEALTMSDRIVVMNGGVIQQSGTPVDIYNEPVNAFVADFIGESNIMDGIMTKDFEVEIFGKKFECVDKDFGENTPVDVVIRPEDVRIVSSADAKICGVVESVIFKGVHYEMTVRADGFNWLVHSTKAAEVGTKAGLEFDPYDIQIMYKTPKSL